MAEEKTAQQKMLELNQHQLSSLRLEDMLAIENKELNLTDDQFYARAGSASGFYRTHFEKVLKAFYLEQLKFIGEKAGTMEQFMFARGTLNGLHLIQMWFEKQEQIMKQKGVDAQEENSEEGQHDVI